MFAYPPAIQAHKPAVPNSIRGEKNFLRVEKSSN